MFLTWASLLGITGRGHSSNTPETQVFVFYKRSGIEAFVLLCIAKSDPNNIKVFYFTALRRSPRHGTIKSSVQTENSSSISSKLTFCVSELYLTYTFSSLPLNREKMNQ